MIRSTQMVAASVLIALAIAVFWLGAPLVPAAVGAGTAGAVLWWSKRGPLETRTVGRLANARASSRSPLRMPR